MTPDWSHSVDVDRVADAHASHGFEYELADLPRLREQLATLVGKATGRVEFRRERGVAIASLEVIAQPALRCQRCLQPVQVPIVGNTKLALVDELAADDALPEGSEPVLLTHGRVLLRDLVEEELLLGLPLIPRHEDVHCVDAKIFVSDENPDATQESPPAETQTPFAGLGELLKRR